MNLPAGFLLPPSTPSSFFKENKHWQNLPLPVPVQRAGRTKGHCCCTDSGSPEGPGTKLPLSRRLPECQRDYYYFGRGSGGDLVLNKVSVQLLPVPCTQHQSSHLAEVSWNSHPAH